jgi:exoribonuclease R
MEEMKPCILDTRQTFGKEKGRFLYRCYPDDNSSPLLIPYEISPQFQKKRCAYYVLVSYNLPIGKLMQNLGEVNEPSHYYEYLLYCKNLQVSHRIFQNVVLSKLKNVTFNDLPFRESKVFTIDGATSIDLDDGFSVDDEKVSIYISCVPYILDQLDLWKHMSERISTIYFPDKRHPMLPKLLSTLCSLNEGTIRPCLVLDLFMDGTTKWEVCSVKIHKNYTYENVCGREYEILEERSGCDHSHDVVHHYMTKYNTLSASILKKGIYLKVNKPEEMPSEWLPAYLNHYSYYDTTGDYAQMTSPIRRLVDILNMMQLTRDLGLYETKDNGFHELWWNQIEKINTSYRAIRKAQNTAKLLDLFEQNQHRILEGIVWDHKVYFKEIGIMMSIDGEYEEYSKHLFTLYLFHDEARLKRKIRIQKMIQE